VGGHHAERSRSSCCRYIQIGPCWWTGTGIGTGTGTGFWPQGVVVIAWWPGQGFLWIETGCKAVGGAIQA